MDIHVSGNLNGRTVVFLAGWPDTSEVFRDNIMAALAPQYRLVGLTLPGFNEHSPVLQSFSTAQKSWGGATPPPSPAAFPVPRMGYSFEGLVDLFEIAILAVMEHRPFERPMLIAHDWGCFIAHEFMLSSPYFFARVVMLDVGGPVLGATRGKGEKEEGGNNKRGKARRRNGVSNSNKWWNRLWQFACILTYQALIIATFLVLPEFIGKAMLCWLLNAAGRPRYNHACAIPHKKEDGIVEDPELFMLPSQVQPNNQGTLQNRPEEHPHSMLLNLASFLNPFSGNKTEGRGGSDDLSVAFYPSQFYYAKGIGVHILPPHPSAIGIQYTCYTGSPRICCANGHCSTGGAGKTSSSSSSSSSSATCKAPQHPTTLSHGDGWRTSSTVEVDTAWGWIYVRFWLLWASRLLPASQRFFIPISIPLLYLYGKDKAVMLHTQEWIDRLEVKAQCDGSDVIPFPGGHWFFAERRNKKRVSEQIAKFLNAEEHNLRCR